MKKLNYLVVGLFVWAGITATAPGEEQLLYLASQQDKTIVVSTVNPDTGALLEKHKVELPGTPGPLAFSPDKKLVYAAMTNVGDVPASCPWSWLFSSSRHDISSVTRILTGISFCITGKVR